ncbi:MAG: YerC/YecD family TrpR-related protein [Robiginitomaculum sp.]|nr:YerC/YecD family TrpR-related protein [Robiginitomaculum sp.]
MSIQKQNLRRRKQLAEALFAAKDAAELERFLVDLCTPAELRALSERWHVAILLDKGELSYRDINAQTGVSTTTIGRVARFLNEEPHQGYRAILDRTQEA